jgi:hypothetical protein
MEAAFNEKKYWQQHQLPGKLGSGGFRWVSFRPSSFSA